MKLYSLAKHEALLALRKARSCGGASVESCGTLPFISQWFGVGFDVIISHYTRAPITKANDRGNVINVKNPVLVRPLC